MAERKHFFTIGADTAPGSKGFAQLARDAKKSMGQVDDSVDDTRSNAQRVADALNGVFEDIDASMMETKATADVLATALGPELAAKVDSTAAVQEFQRLGLTLDEIRGDADLLADTLRRADDVTLKHVGDSAGGARVQMDGLRSSSDQSRSVLANLVGNSAQDLGELGGVAGTAGVGLGQLAEYAVDGNIALSNLAKVAGPLALVSAAGFVIVDAFKSVAETKAFERKRVDGFVEALEDGVVAAGELREILAGDEDTGIFIRWKDETVNVDRSVAKLFDTFAEFNAVVADGQAGYDRWSATADAAAKRVGASQEDVAKTALALQSAIASQGAGAEEAGFLTRFYAEAMDEATAATDAAAGAMGKANTESRNLAVASEVVAAQQEQAADAAERVAQAMQEEADKLNAAVDAMRTAADSSIALDEAQEAFIESVEKATALTEDADATAKDHAEAVDAQRDAMIDAADAAVAQKDAFWRAQGVTMSSKDKLDAFNKSLLSNAQYATPAARAAIADYIIEANNIPAEKATEIRALIEQGKLAEAEAAINNASRARDAAITADAKTQAAEDELNYTARERTAWVNANIRKAGGGVSWSAPGGYQVYLTDSGTPSAPRDGVTIAAERRPEFVDGRLMVKAGIVPPGSRVTGGAETERILKAAAAGGAQPPVVRTALAAAYEGDGRQPVMVFNINLDVHVAAGANKVEIGRQSVDAIVAYLRTGGAGRLRRELGISPV